MPMTSPIMKSVGAKQFGINHSRLIHAQKKKKKKPARNEDQIQASLCIIWLSNILGHEPNGYNYSVLWQL